MRARLAESTDDSEASARLRSGAEADLRAAIRGNPTPARPLRALSELLAGQVRYEEALAFGERAYAEDRYFQDIHATLLRLFQYSMRLGRDADAQRHCSEGRARFPSAAFEDCRLVLMAWSELEAPMPDSAWSIVSRELEAYPSALRPRLEPRLLAHVAAVLAAAGRPDSARAVLARARDADSRSGGIVLASAGTWALLGDSSAAVDEVRRLLANSPEAADRLATAPELRPLAGVGGFRALLDSLAGPGPN
jgi:tetratricopeptide (TPR) repeat protein